MDARALRLLEFDKVLARLASYAATHLGHERCLRLRPRSDPAWVQRRLQETSEARELLAVLGSPPFGGVTDLRDVLGRAQAGSVLAPTELLAAADLAGGCRRLLAYFAHAQEEFGEREVIALGLRLEEYPELEREVARCLTDDGEIAPDASPELERLSRRLGGLRERLRERLEGLAQDYFRRGLLSDPLVVERNGRWCLPVLTSHQGRFPGLVHDRSASGVTLFMEPLETVGSSNELRESELALQQEKQRILAELSALVGRHAPALLGDLNRATALDFIFAKADLSLRLGCVEPRLGEVLDLPAARHPLLGPQAVRVDFRLGDGFRTLVITGPNTGGKTVALKTAGLLSLMAAAGLHLPAGIHAQIPVFAHVFADIGDEQSLEQSLSTFSSHMTQIVRILQRVQAAAGRGEMPVLVLLDEIGAGTDPTEGTALAQALLEELHAAGCFTAVTTHYNELKAFAYAQEGMENASVEFDARTLAPTYHLLIGQPGSSNAFLIAQRLGLPRKVVDSARRRLGAVGRDFARALEKVERTQQQLSAEKREIADTTRELRRLREQHARELEEFQKKRRDALQHGYDEARAVLREASSRAAAIIARLQAQPRHTAASEKLRQELTAERTRLEEEEAALEAEMHAAAEVVAPPEAPRPVEKLAVGLRVAVPQWNKEGVVAEVLDPERALVALGAYHIEMSREELFPALDLPLPPPAVAPLQVRKALAVPPELHLLGYTVDEALVELDKYLDDASLAGRAEVRLVHGKGTGALRAGIHSYLNTHPAVASFALAPDAEGGSGATIVRLKS